jgi:hypothetical protein
MATESQLDANRQNAAHSSGPATTTGKATSSRNALTFGLYTRQDYVTFEEQDSYKEFCTTMYSELSPATLLEQSLAADITGASWRLRRCSAAEGEIASTLAYDPLLDERSEKNRRSIDRARAAAHSILHRSINQLRRLRTERKNGFVFANKEIGRQPAEIEEIRAAIESPPDLASFCKTRVSASAPVVRKPEPPRNAPCPCGSGLKYKFCCFRTGPGWAAPDVKKAA